MLLKKKQNYFPSDSTIAKQTGEIVPIYSLLQQVLLLANTEQKLAIFHHLRHFQMRKNLQIVKIKSKYMNHFYSGFIRTYVHPKRTISFEWIIQKTSFNTSIILHFNVYDKSNTCTWIVSFCCNRIIMIKSSLANSLKEIKAINQIFIEKKINKYLGFLTIRTLWKESKRIQCP